MDWEGAIGTNLLSAYLISPLATSFGGKDAKRFELFALSQLWTGYAICELPYTSNYPNSPTYINSNKIEPIQHCPRSGYNSLQLQ